MSTRTQLPPPLAGSIESLSSGPVAATVACEEHAALVAAIAARTLATPLFVVTATQTQRDRVASVLRFLMENGPVPPAFPRWPRGAESPYDDVVESPFVAAARCSLLSALCLGHAVVCLDAATAARRVPPFDAFMDGVSRVEVGAEIDLTALVDLAIAAGYRRTSVVSEVGELSVRGGIVDLFSPFIDEPVRVELDGDTVASIRVFDPASQRCQRPVSRTWVVPVWDMPCTPERRREAGLLLRDAAAEGGVPGNEVSIVEALIASGRMPPATEALVPLLYDQMGLFPDYLLDDSLVVVIDPDGVRAAADAALDGLRADSAGERGRLKAHPEALAAGGDELLDALRRGTGAGGQGSADRPLNLYLTLNPSGGVLGPTGACIHSPDLVRAMATDVPVADRVSALRGFARGVADSGDDLLMLCPSHSEAERVRSILEAQGMETGFAMADGLAEVLRGRGGASPGPRIGIGRIRNPFDLPTFGLVVLSSEAVFGVKDAVGRRAARAARLSDIRDLSPGDYVIHREHGIGRFEGLEEVRAGERFTECLALSYKGGDRLLVPVERSSLVERYVGGGEDAPHREMDRLGGEAWHRRRHHARKAAREIAQTLQAIYARRMASSAHAFGPRDAEFAEFEATFPWETTPDQDRAIDEVLDDMAGERPMDRLVCGDVGFGKTEVAIRAAFKAVQEGRQVAVLVPTTLLAEQHRLTFAARLRNTPMVVESLSRFKSGSQAREVLKRVTGGAVDILIGTHRILSKDVVFRDLGLLVVDEEHRFGVTHKERIREVSATVHTLTLSATPIPRTLHMSLCGIREMSTIQTPPRDRLAVRTFVARPGRDLVRSAVLRELARGGQVFYVHNRVEDIFDVARRLREIVPEARLGVAHGQMSSADLESVMTAFVRGEIDCLVTTTIIESGLDIGTANTMIISGADSLGLAQLYQLRGRVGRATEQAYCYLLVRDPATMTSDARRRVEAIERFSELASGFNLASMDLEIRGAGNVLGAEQSGHMAAVGYDMFVEMLADAVRELAGEDVQERIDPELKFDCEARLPPPYLADERLRLRFYRRLASARSIAEVVALVSELADRFGPPPVQVDRLAAIMRIKVHARDLGLAVVSLKAGVAQFSAASGHEGVLPGLAVSANVAGCRVLAVEGKDRLRVRVPATDSLGWVEKILAQRFSGAPFTQR